MTIKLPFTLEEMQQRGQAAREDLARALGNFAISFLLMESALDGLIHELLTLAPNTGHALTSAIRSNLVRFQILAALNADLESTATFRRDIETSLEQADDLNGYRNWLFHDRWAGSVAISGGAWSHQKRRMRRGKWQEEAFTSDSIAAKAAECLSVAQRISTISATLNLLRAEARAS